MDQTQLNEAVSRYRRGDENAFYDIYECTERVLYYKALKFMGNEDDANDLLQDTYLIISQKIDSLENNEAFLSWSFRIMNNRAMDRHRKQSKRKEREVSQEELTVEPVVDEGEFEEFLPEAVLIKQELREKVLEIVNALPDFQRRAITMRYFELRSIKEIAAVMGCSENTVKSRLDQGQKKMRRAVEEEERRGNKLYSITAMPILSILLREEMEQMVFSGPGAEAVLTCIRQHTAAAAAGAAASTAAVEGALGSGTAAAGSSAAAAGAAKTAGAVLAQKIGAGLLAAAVVGGAAVGIHTAGNGSVVNWSDPAMERMVRIAIEKPEGEIRTGDLKGITSLMILGETHAKTNKNDDAFQLDRLIGYDSYIIGGVEYTEDGDITSLDDLAAFPDLQSVTVCYNHVSDLSVAAELKELTHLDLYDNDISDLSPLAQAEDLIFLAVGCNEISDLTPLAGLTGLEQLYIFVNGVNDVTPLSGMTRLRELGASSNEITDVTALAGLTALTYLDLNDNPVADWLPLDALGENVVQGRP